MRKLPLSILSALILVLALAGTALAWQAPVLEAECAPDENSFAWSITLTPEENQNIELSWSSDFSAPWLIDFVTSGEHSFTTVQGGSTLHVRYASDHNAKDSADANPLLCEPEEEPDIDIDKFHDQEAPPEEGDTVIYTYEVTNDGNVDLEIALIEDLIVTSPEADPGDIACAPLVRGLDAPGNNDNILNAGDPGETWVFTCSTNELPVGATFNEVCVYANIAEEAQVDLLTQDVQYDASDCADANIVVVEGGTQGGTGTPAGTPAGSLPNTAVGLPSQATPIATFAFGLILVASLGALAFVNVRSSRR